MTAFVAFMLWLGACVLWAKPLGDWLHRLASGCWLDHGDWLRERRETGYMHVCARCGAERPILPGQVYRARTRLAGRRQVVRPIFRRKAS